MKLHRKAPLDAIVRFEELITQKAALVERVLAACGFDVSEHGLEEVEGALMADAHGDNAA